MEAGEAARAEGVGGLARRMEALEVDAVHDHPVRHVEEAAAAAAGGDDGVHPPDEPFGVGGMATLPGRCEDELHRHAQDIAQEEPGQHLRVAASMPDAEATAARPPPECCPLEPAEPRKEFRQAGADGGDAERPPLQGDQVDDRRGDAGEPPLEIRGNHLDIGNLDTRPVKGGTACRGAGRAPRRHAGQMNWTRTIS